MKIKTRDVILIALAALLNGPGTARVLLSLAQKYLNKKFGETSDIELETFRVVLARLHKSKLIAKAGSRAWKLTGAGRSQARHIQKNLAYQEFKDKTKNKIPDTIIIFDVPEINRKKRDYLRFELLSLGYQPLQKSVWRGSSPLPMEFMEYLREMKLLSYIQIFTVKEFGTIA